MNAPLPTLLPLIRHFCLYLESPLLGYYLQKLIKWLDSKIRQSSEQALATMLVPNLLAREHRPGFCLEQTGENSVF